MKIALLIFVQVFVVAVTLALAMHFANQRLTAHYESRPHLKFRRQLLQVAAILLVVLFVILFMPFGAVLQEQLLRLYGLIISATIALSSTTLVGNVMAGIMLKIIGTCRPGNFITVGEYFGRVSEMDLLHTEIQTEDRDLTTLPNLYLVTKPVRVMMASGTMLKVELSLGYDVSRHKVEELLTEAAIKTGLESPFVQIRDLGDYSVTYRVSGLLTEINRLLDKRRELRARTIDSLHAHDIEIVSPTFMSTRAYDADRLFVSDAPDIAYEQATETSPDAVVFDKAEKAESLEKLREQLADAQNRIKACEEEIDEPSSDQAADAARAEKENYENRVERLKAVIDRREAKISEE